MANSLWRTIGRDLRLQWKPLVSTDLLFKVLAFVVLTPIVGILFRTFLSVSGRSVLADADLARFFIHPIGWIAATVVGGAVIGVLALEQSVLMTLSLGARHEQPVTVPGSFQFVARRSKGIFILTGQMVARILWLSAPFLAIGGGLFWFLLTKHDINYYLAEKPPSYWFAVVSIGSVLAVLAFLIIRCVVSWSIAIQLHLFEGVSAKASLTTSHQRVLGHRKTITKWVVSWLVVNLLISSLVSSAVLLTGRMVIPSATGQLWTLVLTVGAMVLLWGVSNLATSLLAVISFALMQAEVYDRFGRREAFELGEGLDARAGWSLSWTPIRTVVAAALVVLLAGLVGATLIGSVRLNDDVEITAHRGASGKAPENTMAAVRQAIEDQADWVEIDVQESKDGIVVVAHDSDLKKVAGVDTKIWEGTLEELQSVDIGSYFGTEFADERVPTLAEVLEACRGKVGVNIELKYYGHDQDLEREVVALVEEYAMASDVIIMSLESSGVDKIKALRPTWTVGLLTAVAAGDLTRANADFLAVSTKLARPALIRSAHRKDKQVFVWTVNDAITMSTMISRGADNLITDYPDLARRVLEERASMNPIERILVELAFRFGAGSSRDTLQ